jgi:hypothetical protein
MQQTGSHDLARRGGRAVSGVVAGVGQLVDDGSGGARSVIGSSVLPLLEERQHVLSSRCGCYRFSSAYASALLS